VIQKQIIVETDRVALCAPELCHVDALAGLWGDLETMRYIGAGGVWTREQVAERIERAIKMQNDRGMTFWTVVEKATGVVMGQGGVVPIAFDGEEFELGYRLGNAHWGKGYATEIARASAAYAFNALGLDALVAVTYPENHPSRRVLIKTGFREVGESELYYGVPTIVYRMGKNDCVL